MTRVSSEHGVATTRMGQLCVEGMIMKGGMHVTRSTKMERDEKNDSRSWMG